MKLWIFSDLHLRPGERFPPDVPDAEVAVVAGDVTDGLVEAVTRLGRAVRPRMPVVAVAGNHEYHGGVREAEIARGLAAAADHGVHLLEDTAVEIDGVTFLGGTLWTDYLLDGPANRAAAMLAALRGMPDHREIVTGRPTPRRILPADTLDLHEATVRFLEGEARRARRGPTVVVTHHAPTARSLDPVHESDPLAASFASPLDGLVGRLAPDLWVHGHVHVRVDHRVGPTRVLCNPRGHGGATRDFDPALVVEIV